MPKLRIEFEGFNEVVQRLKDLGADVQKTADSALMESKKIVNRNLEAAMQKHNKTHETVDSIDTESKVMWVGGVGTIHVGFNLKEGGMPSIYLMHGTKVNGTPRIPKDSKLYNAVYGSKVRKEIKKLQEDAFYDEIRRIERSK